MSINTEDIKQVLAMFDKEDIPYINFEYLINKNILKSEKTNKKHNIKIKKLGGRNDKPRK